MFYLLYLICIRLHISCVYLVIKHSERETTIAGHTSYLTNAWKKIREYITCMWLSDCNMCKQRCTHSCSCHHRFCKSNIYLVFNRTSLQLISSRLCLYWLVYQVQNWKKKLISSNKCVWRKGVLFWTLISSFVSLNVYSLFNRAKQNRLRLR